LLNKLSLKSRLVLRFSLGLISAAAMLFVPAGSLKFWRAWAFMALTFPCGVFFFAYFYKHDPQLAERRLQTKENVSEQQFLHKLRILISFLAFLLPGLDYRFGWSRTSLGPVPLWLTLLAQALLLGSFALIFWVMKVNSFASRTIQVEADQKVVSTGPYRIVRHPLYFGTLVAYLSIPLALGSYVALPAFALLIPVVVLRLLNEEKILCQELAGYTEYCLRTRFRLVPYIW
jgi:protein-S-isoprenylcysteine O-methyltransferase Ste14